MSWFLIRLIQLYRLAISPLLGPRCRFWPTCSAYAIDALQTHGAIVGLGYLCRRLSRCHPWHPGGVDPVPARAPSERPN